MEDKEKQELESIIRWFRKRVKFDDVYVPHLRFILKEYADKVHEIRKNEKD
jgi:hypothetical protein